MPLAFHEVRFPLDVALGARGGPERATEIVTLASGREQRNARRAHSRRRYDAGYGVKTLVGLAAIVAFFEERRGQLTGFRWRDRLDYRSGAPEVAVTPLDQSIGSGDGVTRVFQLVKRYGGAFDPYVRPIAKPVSGTVRLAVAGVEKFAPTHFSVDHATGLATFTVAATPAAGAAITAGFEFDVPVRFDAEALDIDLSAFAAGAIPKIPLVEIIV